MTALAALNLLTTYGPTALTLAQKLIATVEAGRGNEKLTEADWAELNRLASLTGADIYARLGITPPTK